MRSGPAQLRHWVNSCIQRTARMTLISYGTIMRTKMGGAGGSHATLASLDVLLLVHIAQTRLPHCMPCGASRWGNS